MNIFSWIQLKALVTVAHFSLLRMLDILEKNPYWCFWRDAMRLKPVRKEWFYVTLIRCFPTSSLASRKNHQKALRDQLSLPGAQQSMIRVKSLDFFTLKVDFLDPCNQPRMDVLPLYASLSPQQQIRVFEPSKAHKLKRKVINKIHEKFISFLNACSKFNLK